MRTAPEPPLQAGQGMVKQTALDTVQKWTGLWVSVALKHGSDTLVWVHPKSKWIADSTLQLQL